MQLVQKRTLLIFDNEGRKKLGEINEGDDIQFIDARGRYKYGCVKKVLNEGLILITDGSEWHMPLRHIEHIAMQ